MVDKVLQTKQNSIFKKVSVFMKKLNSCSGSISPSFTKDECSERKSYETSFVKPVFNIVWFYMWTIESFSSCL